VNHCRVEKSKDDVEPRVVRRSWDKLWRYLLTDGAASGIQGGLNLEEAVVWNMRTLASMVTEKPQVV